LLHRFYLHGSYSRLKLSGNVLLQGFLIRFLCADIRHGIDKFNPLRKLEHRGFLPSQKGNDFIKGQLSPGFGLNIGTNPFAHNRIRHGDDGHGPYIRVTADESLDFYGTDTLTAPPGRSHMGYLHGVREPLCKPGHIVRRKFSLVDQSFEA
jgi:hypothetical protein